MKTSVGIKLALALVGTAAVAACQPAATAYEYGGPAPSYRTGTYGTPAPDPYVDGYAYGGQSSTYQVIIDDYGRPVYRDGRRDRRHGVKPEAGYQPYYKGRGQGSGHRKGYGKRSGYDAAQNRQSGSYQGQGKRKSAREAEAELQHQRALERQAYERARAKERARAEKQRRAAYLAEEQRRAEIRASRRAPGLSEYVPYSVAEIGIVFDGYRHVGENNASLADRVRRAQRVADVEGISIHRVLEAQKPKSFDQK